VLEFKRKETKSRGEKMNVDKKSRRKMNEAEEPKVKIEAIS
jgi:hypothetical protein